MTEVELIEKTAIRVGMKSLMNHGAASCVYSEGCNGVSQEHLIAFAREVALHCVASLAGDQWQKPVEASATGAVAEVESFGQGSYSRNYKLRWLRDVPVGTKLYATPTTSTTGKVDVEQMLRDCVPGGSSCDPQAICDDIRNWFANGGKNV
jgi:hypothetical protein